MHSNENCSDFVYLNLRLISFTWECSRNIIDFLRGCGGGKEMIESLIVSDDKDSVGTKSIRLRFLYYYYISISMMNCGFFPNYEMETSVKNDHIGNKTKITL